VHEDVLFGVVAVNEAVAALHVEPLDGAGDFGGCNGKGRDCDYSICIYISLSEKYI